MGTFFENQSTGNITEVVSGSIGRFVGSIEWINRRQDDFGVFRQCQRNFRLKVAFGIGSKSCTHCLYGYVGQSIHFGFSLSLYISFKFESRWFVFEVIGNLGIFGFLKSLNIIDRINYLISFFLLYSKYKAVVVSLIVE